MDILKKIFGNKNPEEDNKENYVEENEPRVELGPLVYNEEVYRDYEKAKGTIEECKRETEILAKYYNENKNIHEIVIRHISSSDLLINGTEPLDNNILEIDPGHHDIHLFKGSYAVVPEGKVYSFYGVKLYSTNPKVFIESVDFDIDRQLIYRYVFDPHYKVLGWGTKFYFSRPFIFKPGIQYDIIIHAENLTDTKQKLRLVLLGYVAEPIY